MTLTDEEKIGTRRPHETPDHGPREVATRYAQTTYKPTVGKLDPSVGPWEQIFYGEFDGRRDKRVLIKIIGEY